MEVEMERLAVAAAARMQMQMQQQVLVWYTPTYIRQRQTCLPWIPMEAGTQST